jgi:phosphoenolpyruvate carboxykinase (GTP)
MLKFNQGIDIVEEIGQLASEDEALALFEDRLDSTQLDRIRAFKNPAVVKKIANAINLCDPERIFINTGSEQDLAFIRQLALNKGEEAPLPMGDHTIHFDLKEEQGRIIDRTYYISNDDEIVSSLGLRMSRRQALETVRKSMGGVMNGMTMIVGFYSRGPLGAQVSNPAIEITSSAYVSHSAELLYRNIYADFEEEVDRTGHFYTNIHSEGLNRAIDLPDARVLMDRSHRTTYSFKCTYAGNTLLLKKGNHRFSVDRSVYEKRGLELSEHMFITGINGPGNRVTWITGAAPSGCGKTTTAMAGNHFVGDDLAQMWIADDGTIRSINPECRHLRYRRRCQSRR